MLRRQELKCNSEVNQQEKGFQGAHFLHLPSPSPPTTTFAANDKWKVGVGGGRWVLAKRVSHLLLSDPASHVILSRYTQGRLNSSNLASDANSN